MKHVIVMNLVTDQVTFRNGCLRNTRVQVRCQDRSDNRVSYAGYDDIQSAFDAFHHMQCTGLILQLGLLIPEAGVYLVCAQWDGETEITWENEPVTL